MKQYEVYVKLVKKELGSVPFEEIDEPTFREAVQKVRGESSRNEYAGHNGARRPRKWCSQTA